ncbi:MAG: hypothetical protein H6925_03775 [Holosporaceae bacterium]|nr:MAG: hypothetical protein H6925_03775 [Holosporaceae bacterium]
MKKIFKSMLFVGASLTALACSADEGRAVTSGPTLSFGGSVTGYGVGTNQKVRIQGNAPAVNFVSKGNLVMSVGGQATNGMTYGAVGVVQFDRAKTGIDRISEAYVYGNHDMLGSFKLGDTEGVVSNMMYSGTDVLGGLGGSAGDLDKLINLTRAVDFRPSIAPRNDKATKLVWVSPEYKGFQIGLDFTPSTKLRGREGRGSTLNNGATPTMRNNSIAPYSTNLLGGGISYNKAFQKCNFGLYVVGHTGKSRGDAIAANSGGSQNTYHDTKAWQVGTLVDYQNWQFAASYFDRKKSWIRKQAATVDGVAQTNPTSYTNTKGVDLGIGYDFARNANLGVGYTHIS